MDGGRRQQKHGSFFADTSGATYLYVETTNTLRPCEGSFLFATFSLDKQRKSSL